MSNYVISISREFGSGGRLIGKQLAECHVLLLIGQLAKQQQIGDFLIAKALFPGKACNQLVDVIAPVDQAALHGGLFAVDDGIALNRADFRAANHNAGTVCVSEASFDIAVISRTDIKGCTVFQFLA